MKKYAAILIVVLTVAFSFAYAHSGRTNKDGCHNDRKNDTYHCH
jgi:hypothetical protein